MLALRLYGSYDVRLDEVAEPDVRAGTVKIKIARAGICGSDLSLYQYSPVPQDRPHPIMQELGPKTMGHEFSGYVTEIAPNVKGIAVGDLVAVQPNFGCGTCAACQRGDSNLCSDFAFIGINGWGGGFSEYVVVPADHVFVLPEGFTPEVGALVESLAVAWHAAKRSGAGPGTVALVVGAGPIGLGLILSLRALGVDRVIVSELSASRKALAKEFGGDVMDPGTVDLVEYVKEATGGAGVDVSFDASGVGESTLSPALSALRNGGVNVVVAQFHSDIRVNPSMFMVTEKVMTGSFAYVRSDFQEVIDAIADGRINPARLVSSTVGLSQIIEGGIKFLLSDGKATEVKMLVDPSN